MDWQNISFFEATKQLETDISSGLTDAQARARLEKYGENVLTGKKHKSMLTKFLLQFCDFMIIILLCAAAISFITSFMQPDGDIVDPIIILAIVVVNAVIGVIQESRAEHAIAALQRITAPETTVIRSEKQLKIPSRELTCGDVIILESGDLVPADARLCESINLKTEESSLTGESLPVEKNAGMVLQGKSVISDRKNMVYSGSVVVSGRGKALVTATGMDTEIGRIAHMINQEDEQTTPLQQRLAHTGKLLGIAALGICLIIFIMGLLQHVPALDTFMISVSLAVAAIPEGLPAIVTIVLALGVQKMAKKNAIIRRLPAVETLGGATVICSDKTGTLTMNKMTVTEVAELNGVVSLKSDQARQLLSLASLCNNSSMQRTGGELIAKGDPTEIALITACADTGVTKQGLDNEFPRVRELPFDSSRKLMTTVHKLKNGMFRIITKGAPDVLISKCSSVQVQGNVKQISGTDIKAVETLNFNMASRALRVLAVAYRDVSDVPSDDAKLEKSLIFCGLIGMIDPPREDVRQAVMLCRRAGIKPVMITGDHVVTATAIAKQIGIISGDKKALTGAQLDEMDQHELERTILSCAVFARVSPEHKVRIVKAFQRRGEVVAMTGDGVNDAPALKAADIGCAMGKGGTEVAKSASDMVLTDDNFSTIVSAVREGRGIYDNIKKAVHFLLSCNIGEILTVFIASLFALPSPLLAIQLLWVNLVTDSLPAISLGLEPTEPDVMYRKPINRKKSLFADGLGIDIILEGCMIGAFTLLAFSIGRTVFDATAVPFIGRTMAFAVLSLSQLVHAFNVRSRHSVFEIGIFSNLRMNLSFLVCAALQIVVITIPALSAIFKTVPLNLPQWTIVVILSSMPLLTIEIGKRLTSAMSPKKYMSFDRSK